MSKQKKISRRTSDSRLLKLAAMLEADAKNKNGIQFNLHTVGKPASGNEIFKDVEDLVNCGTEACAMGLAAISGKFKRAGLSAKIRPSVNSVRIETALNSRIIDYDFAAMKIFGISQREAWYLFDPSEYPFDKRAKSKGERFVAKRIRKFVEKRGKGLDPLSKHFEICF